MHHAHILTPHDACKCHSHSPTHGPVQAHSPVCCPACPTTATTHRMHMAAHNIMSCDIHTTHMPCHAPHTHSDTHIMSMNGQHTVAAPHMALCRPRTLRAGPAWQCMPYHSHETSHAHGNTYTYVVRHLHDSDSDAHAMPKPCPLYLNHYRVPPHTCQWEPHHSARIEHQN